MIQLALELFGWAPAPASADTMPALPGSPSVHPSPSNSKRRTAGDEDGREDEGHAKPVKAPTEPPTPLHSVLDPASFRHPQANREVMLGHAYVGYVLQRARRRSIGFVVDADGLSVRAPGWVTIGAIHAALQEKADWIVRKLGESRERQQRKMESQIEWLDGAVFPFMGEPLKIVLDSGHRFKERGGALMAAAEPGAPRELHIALATHAEPTQVRDAVQAWLLRQARAHFVARLDHFAPQLNVRWTRLRLSSAQTRWGSARADGSICLNWRLLHFRPSVIDYVVAHELSHLRVMDHSPRFWDTVASVVPDYKALRSSLKDEALPSWN